MARVTTGCSEGEAGCRAERAAGGAIALAGALVYAELAARRPAVGGQYACIREAFHPSLAFVYAWGLLPVTQTGGMAAVAVTFARYFLQLTGTAVPPGLVAAAALTGPPPPRSRSSCTSRSTSSRCARSGSPPEACSCCAAATVRRTRRASGDFVRPATRGRRWRSSR